MSDLPLIETRGLTKTYVLNSTPTARMFNLFKKKTSDKALDPSRVHFALKDISVSVDRGEKVGIIGRNGAGKSTFLKLVTGVIQPTSGELKVRGESHALLSLGAGFHPEFTGRENAYAFLAHMGYSGKKADRLVEDTISFAEIEEFIDQPLKTYSTGMQARLMFAVSTALEPELLVIDEVLGVGDAYFQQKSFDRIRELCEANDTSLLLVSHDIYQAAKLVDRIIWIDRGHVAGDGDPVEMIQLYENSIRLQEDARQKQKLALGFRDTLKHGKGHPPAFIEFRARNNEPAASSVFFKDVSLVLDKNVHSLPLLDESSGVSLVADNLSAQRLQHVAWGDLSEREGATVRIWQNFGAVDHKCGFALFGANRQTFDKIEQSDLSFTCATNDSVDADIVYVQPDCAERVIGRFQSTPGTFETVTLAISGGSDVRPAISAQNVESSGRQGSGRILATNIEIMNDDGQETFVFSHGDAVRLRLSYHINDPDLEERSQVVFVFRRNGVEDIARVIARDTLFKGDSPNGAIDAYFASLPLGTGTYSVTLLLAKEGYFENTNGKFFAINPDVYDCRRDVLEFEIVDRDSIISHGTGTLLNPEWTMRSHQTKSDVKIGS